MNLPSRAPVSHRDPSLTSPRRRNRFVPWRLVTLWAAGILACGFGAPRLQAQITGVGGIARNVTMTDRATGLPVRLYDFAGHVILLDFFAYWCGPCQSSSPDVEANVKRYFEARGGNTHGVPVKVIAVNIDSSNESATDQFVRNAGLDSVLNDYSESAYNQFQADGIPLFVIINGVAGAQTYNQWQVMYRQAGYAGAYMLRSVIDLVQVTGPATIVSSPASRSILAGDTLRLEVVASGTQPITYKWFKGGQPISGATQSVIQKTGAQASDSGSYEVEVRNALGWQRSNPALIQVVQAGTPRTFAFSGFPLNIPDDNPNGISSRLVVNDSFEVIRIKVNVRISHTYRGDLRVVLRAPGGRERVLADFNPGDDSSGLLISNLIIPEFAGLSSQGTWTLAVIDDYAVDTGRLESWSLEMTPAAPTLGSLFTQWMQSFPGLDASQHLPGADPDHDGVPNLLEYLLAGQSPIVAARGPGVVVSTAAPNYYEYVVTWRAGVDASSAKVFLSANLDNGSWTEAATQGTDILVDRTDPSQLVVRIHRSWPRTFLQLRATPGF